MPQGFHPVTGSVPKGLVPWRYLVPRPRYARLLRVARACPELRPYIDREAFLKGVDAAALCASLAMAVLALPFLLAGLVGLVMTQLTPRMNLRERLDANAEAANRLLPPAEVERRLARP